jgi:transcriptional regulator with XRE-family HTH domain
MKKKSSKKLKSIGARIKQARVDEGLSQKELATKIQLSDKAISSYEVDRSQPSFDVLQKIGKVTKRPVRYFVDQTVQQDVEIEKKLEKIEQELAEIRRLLTNKE